MKLIKINCNVINNILIPKLFLVSCEKNLNLLVIILTFYGRLQRRTKNSGVYRRH